MYKVYVNDSLLYDPSLQNEEYELEYATLDEEINTQGSFDFKVPTTNRLWDSLNILGSRVRIDSDGLTIWRGRIIEIQRNWDNVKQCHAEGDLAIFQDSIITPFAFKGSPSELFTALIDKHNSQMTEDATKRFTVGSVTVTDPNGIIVRSSENAMTAWDALSEKCFDSSLGGYITLTGSVVSWLADFTTVSTQKVKFSQNLIDLAIETAADEIATCLIPYGAKFEESAGTPPYEVLPTPSGQTGDKYVEWNGNRLTVASVNSGNVMLRNNDAIQKFGEIVATKVWDDITVASNLLTAGNAWLTAEFSRILTSLEITAADLHLLDSELAEIRPGMYVPVESPPHMILDQLLCTMKTTDIIDPSQTTITLGVGQKPLTSIIGGA